MVEKYTKEIIDMLVKVNRVPFLGIRLDVDKGSTIFKPILWLQKGKQLKQGFTVQQIQICNQPTMFYIQPSMNISRALFCDNDKTFLVQTVLCSTSKKTEGSACHQIIHQNESGERKKSHEKYPGSHYNVIRQFFYTNR